MTYRSPTPLHFKVEPTAAALVGLLALGLLVQLTPQASPGLSDTSLVGVQDHPALSSIRIRTDRGPIAPVYSEILDRPLFSSQRSGTEFSDTAPVGALALVGVASGSGRASATIFPPGGPAQSLRIGDVVQGWRLRGVGRDRVVLSHGSALQVLRIGATALTSASAAVGVAPR